MWSQNRFFYDSELNKSICFAPKPLLGEKMSRLLLCYSQELLETLPKYKETFESFTAHAYGNHVVYYSCHEWSGTWCDICIEQRLMKAAKSEGTTLHGC